MHESNMFIDYLEEKSAVIVGVGGAAVAAGGAGYLAYRSMKKKQAAKKK